MTLRPATLVDHPAIEAFLRRHEASSLFPLTNLVAGSQSGPTMWIAETRGDVQGMLALTPSGFLMLQWPALDAPAAARALSGRRISAINGPDDQVTSLVGGLGIGPGELRRNGREPLCQLSLSDLILPDATGTRLAPLGEADRNLIIGWRMAYNAETMGQAELGARDQARRDVDRWLEAGNHRILWAGGEPVALTGLNARLPDVVQVGGVFVPPALRSHGYARRAVALHLAEARAFGAERAVLFAASPAALRAYQAIGFTQTGWMGLALLHKTLVPA